LSFIDEVKIYVKAGDGGKGCKSFYTDPLTYKKHPDGGDGGKGGDVIIKTNPSLWDLTSFKYKKYFKAESGKHGSSNKKKGKNGKPLYIFVPCGTIVKDAETSLLMRDMIEGELVIAKGGKGGRGNACTKREPIPPQEGEEKYVSLQLKIIADVGLIGLPNAGKTTLINSLCGTKARVASYPFTTLSPHLGILNINDRVVKIADIPGLIEQAHKGKGLGDKFLRHIERTRLLVFLLDLSSDTILPWDAFYILKNELEMYDKILIEKPYIIVGNKIDIPNSGENFKKLRKKLKKENIYAISALEKIGFDLLIDAISKCL
jgi:GTP-binding protein